jgi:hypothetical protein
LIIFQVPGVTDPDIAYTIFWEPVFENADNITSAIVDLKGATTVSMRGTLDYKDLITRSIPEGNFPT